MQSEFDSPVQFSDFSLGAEPAESFLLADLRQALTREGDVRIDASQVERFSCACVQLLLSVSARLRAAGQQLIIQNPSFTFALAFEALGFEGDLDIFTVEYSAC